MTEWLDKFRTPARDAPRPEPTRIVSVVTAADLAALSGPTADAVKREASRRAARAAQPAIARRIVRKPDDE
jgi:hypothetical protein